MSFRTIFVEKTISLLFNMNNVLSMIENRVPSPVLDNIHSYLKNEAMEKALREYFRYLSLKRDLYRDFVYDQYVVPQCNCANLPPKRECTICYLFESTSHYDPEDYKICIDRNPQYDKIMFGGSIWER